MKDILHLLEEPINAEEPVVALDERPVPLRADVRPPQSAAAGQSARRDGQYRRQGVAKVFALLATHEGRHLTHATRV